MKKRQIALLVVLVILAFGVAFPFLQAAHQMKEYLRIVNPHFAPYVKLFATYNPVDGAFNMRITDDSGASIFLECVSDGRIIDEMRTNKYLEDNNISTHFTVEETSSGNLHCYWKYSSPENPLFLLSIHERGGISVTSEAQLEAVLKERMLAHYEQLPDIVIERLFRCHTAHQTDSAMYRITVFTTTEDDFESLLNQAEMTKEELKNSFLIKSNLSRR